MPLAPPVTSRATTPEMEEALQEEARELLARMQHVNVVQFLGMVHGPAPDSGGVATWMICLEYCESDLDKRIYGDIPLLREAFLDMQLTLTDLLVRLRKETSLTKCIRVCIQYM